MLSRTACLAALALCIRLAPHAAAQQRPGYPSRAANLDVLPGFRTPPPGYGEVAFYWWLGDPLTKQRLTWQLNQLQGRSISGLQVNYAHSDRGGRSYGLTYESDPKLFSEPWWELFQWFLQQARRRGMAASLSDYTLGWAGNGWYMDRILQENPGMSGAALATAAMRCTGPCEWQLPPDPLSLTAFPLSAGRILPGHEIDLLSLARGGRLAWTPPPGDWRIVAVYAKPFPVSLNPMHPESGRQMIAKFFQPFEDRNPGQSGQGLNFFFSDELNFGVRGWLWDQRFAAEFLKRKGYDPRPELASLFEETGPRAVKLRLDYSDVMVSLSEQNYFRPLYEWHESRGLIYGCDHGGRGRDVTEFGDYFRTQRWMSGPGNDQPNLASDIVKNKVASSIAHLYERPRTWLEGFYGSGWGTTSAQIVDATWRNFVQGHNLLTLHGLYYSTYGGWWEWAPPCNHFHMPYWAHMGEFLQASERLSYLLSQGVHRADVAVVYPVAPMEAGRNGKESVQTAFSIGQRLYEAGIDFDFIDFESLQRARVEGGRLRVAGEEYRALVLPAMPVVRHSTIEQAVAFHKAGGLVIAVGPLPAGSDRTGDGDPEVLALSALLAPARAAGADDVIAKLDAAFPRDFHCNMPKQPSILHRKAGARDIYMIYGAERGAECTLRSTGRLELWDPWSGSTALLPVLRQSATATTLRLPLEKTEAQLLVFTPGEAARETAAPPAPNRLAVTGPWEFELKPALDNRYGDYRLPAAPEFIGAEARRLLYREQGEWTRTTYTYGPRFLLLGPVASTSVTEEQVRREGRPYEFSWRFGIEGDPGHQGYHGLKAQMPRDFIALGKREFKSTTTVYTPEPSGNVYYLWTSVYTSSAITAQVLSGGLLPAAVSVNGKPVDPAAGSVPLQSGWNSLLLRYASAGQGHFVLLEPGAPLDWKQPEPLATDWYRRPGLLEFDIHPGTENLGWYRTTAPPGLRAITLPTRAQAELRIAGKLVPLKPLPDGYSAEVEPIPSPAQVEIRLHQRPGRYAGAAFDEPLKFSCEKGLIELGDWSQLDGLSSYSGGAWYRKQIEFPAAAARGKAWLDLGSLSSSAEVWVNGTKAGVKLAAPFRVEVTGLLKPGPNRVEVLVYSALSGHYETIPTRYRRPSPSGLIGPVELLYQ
ncbi:MAG: hypothetical protein HY821_11590 [Acidobacteria bacterium]|nr:hypothetical protein [Acidobacteriota bacterium]